MSPSSYESAAHDDNVYTRLEFLKAVSHSLGAHSCNLYTESTDSDGDSPDDDQASADSATVNVTGANETNYCDVCLVAQHEPRLALLSCGHQRFCECWSVLEVVVLSAVRALTTSTPNCSKLLLFEGFSVVLV